MLYETTVFIHIALCCSFCICPKVGIGTTTPDSTLDVRGNLKVGGLNKYFAYDSVSGKLLWVNSNLYVPVNQQLIQHSASAEGLFYNNSGLEYRNQFGTPVFSTNWNSGIGYFGGNVGIGTLTPAARLHIQNGISGFTPNYSSLIVETNGNNYISFFTPDTVYQSAILFEKPAHPQSGGIYYNSPSAPDGLILRANNAPRMIITNNGNVGVGTTNPLARLHVADSSVVFSVSGVVPGVTGNPPISGAGRRMMWYADKAAFRAGYVASDEWDKIYVGNYSFAAGENSLAIGYASTVFGSNGQATGDYSTSLGGENSASGYASAVIGFNSVASGSHSMAIGYSTFAKSVGGISLGMWADNSDVPDPTVAAATDRLFQVGNGSGPARSNAITILRNGNVGIGTTNPRVRLHIIDGASGYTGLWFPGITLEGNGPRYLNIITSSNDESGVLFGISSYGAAHGGIVYNNGSNPNGMQFRTNGNTTRMVIDASGNVGMGTTAPTQRLHVVGNICATGSVGSCSDIRYKTNITPLNHILSSVLGLQGIYYDWKKEEYPEMQFSNERQIGFSAQEVEKIFPEVVLTDNRGYKSIDYAKLTPVAIEAIKEQQQQIDEMKIQIAELTKTLEKLLKK